MRSATPEGYVLTEHPAEVGIKAWASSRERTLELALEALVSVMTDPLCVGSEQEFAFSVRGGEPRDVLRRALSEALFLISSENVFLTSFNVEWNDTVTIKCRGEPIDPDRHELRTEVKAITPSGLSFTQEDSWTATSLLDV